MNRFHRIWHRLFGCPSLKPPRDGSLVTCRCERWSTGTFLIIEPEALELAGQNVISDARILEIWNRVQTEKAIEELAKTEEANR